MTRTFTFSTVLFTSAVFTSAQPPVSLSTQAPRGEQQTPVWRLADDLLATDNQISFNQGSLLATAACGSVSTPTPPTLPVPSILTYDRDDWPRWIDPWGARSSVGTANPRTGPLYLRPVPRQEDLCVATC